MAWSIHPRLVGRALVVVGVLLLAVAAIVATIDTDAGPSAEVWPEPVASDILHTVAGAPCSPSDALDVGITPSGVAADADGGFFVSDTIHNVVCHVDDQGRLTLFAGNGAATAWGDGGPATRAGLYEPTGLAVRPDGALLVADRRNNRIRVVTPDGTISTLAGTGAAGFAGDGGPATSASLHFPTGVAVDSDGTVLIADNKNNRIRSVAPDGTISTLAGTGAAGFAGDGGSATSASLHFPTGVAVDSDGTVLIADAANNRIRSVSDDGVVRTVAGDGVAASDGDGGPATAASVWFPLGVAISPSGDVLVADSGGQRIRSVASSGTITTLAGNGVDGYAGDDGPAGEASLDFPAAVAVDGNASVLVVDQGNRRIREVSDGTITTRAGNGTHGHSGDGGPATVAELHQPTDIVVASDGSLLVADGLNHVVRRIDGDGLITTIAGTPGVGGHAGDGGPAINAELGFVTGLAEGPDGSIYVADWTHHIRRIDPEGIISTIAGTGELGFGGDGGPASSAALAQPGGLEVGLDGSLYIADSGNHRIRRLEPVAGVVLGTSPISTVVGTGEPGAGGDGGSASKAQLSGPSDVAMIGGHLVVADTDNHRIRLVDSEGRIRTVAGSGALGWTPDGTTARDAAFNHPVSVAAAIDGGLWIADKGNCVVRKVSALTGSDATVVTAAGWTPQRGVTPVCGFGGQGVDPTSGGTMFYNPLGLAVTSEGTLLIADSLTHRVRALPVG